MTSGALEEFQQDLKYHAAVIDAAAAREECQQDLKCPAAVIDDLCCSMGVPAGPEVTCGSH